MTRRIIHSFLEKGRAAIDLTIEHEVIRLSECNNLPSCGSQRMKIQYGTKYLQHDF